MSMEGGGVATGELEEGEGVAGEGWEVDRAAAGEVTYSRKWCSEAAKL